MKCKGSEVCGEAVHKKHEKNTQNLVLFICNINPDETFNCSTWDI